MDSGLRHNSATGQNASPDDGLPIQEIIEAARRPDVRSAMTQFFDEADRRISAQPATCWNRGLCCRFGEYGHRLYVTALEVCYYLATGAMPPPPTGDVCPHAVEGMCHARDRRPLGCRIFFCDVAAQYWQGPLTEELLGRLRDLHAKLDVPYFYADWIGVLRALREHDLTAG